MTRVQPNSPNARMLLFEQCEQRRCLASLNVGLHEILTIPDEVTDIEPADMDGDGDLDVAVSTRERKLVWHENIDGGGSFGGAQEAATERWDSRSTIALGDVDGDGDLDISDVLHSCWP